MVMHDGFKVSGRRGGARGSEGWGKRPFTPVRPPQPPPASARAPAHSTRSARRRAKQHVTAASRGGRCGSGYQHSGGARAAASRGVRGRGQWAREAGPPPIPPRPSWRIFRPLGLGRTDGSRRGSFATQVLMRSPRRHGRGRRGLEGEVRETRESGPRRGQAHGWLGEGARWREEAEPPQLSWAVQGRRAGKVPGRFVCLFGKPKPGETVTRFSLDGMGANGSVWQGGGLELISLGGRKGAEGRGGVAWVP